MKCLTTIECSEWLRHYGIDESPYKHDIYKGVYYIQFEPPTLKEEISPFVQALVKSLGNFEGCLLQINDWMYDSEFEVEPTSDIRLRHGESRPLIDAPGFIFDLGELADAIELITLILERGWSAYLYPSSKAATLLLWEGALVDFWSNNVKVQEQFHAELCRNNLCIVHRYKGEPYAQAGRFAASPLAPLSSTLGAMTHSSDFTTPYKYVHEAIWLPTYAVVTLVILGTVSNSSVATVVMLVGLLVCRILLELLYRFAFGDERLTVRIALLALGSQLVVWAGYWGGICTVHKKYNT